MRLTLHSSSPAITRSRGALIATLIAMAAITGCSKKQSLPNNSAQLGLNNSTSQNGAAPGTKQDFTVNVGDRVFFTTDSSSLTGEARATLDKQASWLNRYGQYAIKVEGHADERGTREYNIALGARRAAATRDYLASKGVARSRLKTISFGKERPVAVCDNISCWSQNRRAVTLLGGAGS